MQMISMSARESAPGRGLGVGRWLSQDMDVSRSFRAFVSAAGCVSLNRR
jgi:hypothetical protein